MSFIPAAPSKMRCSFFVGFLSYTQKGDKKRTKSCHSGGAYSAHPTCTAYAPCLIYYTLKITLHTPLEDKKYSDCVASFAGKVGIEYSERSMYVEWRRTILFIKIFFSSVPTSTPILLFVDISPVYSEPLHPRFFLRSSQPCGTEAFTLPLRLFHVRMFPPRLVLCSRCPWMIDFCALFSVKPSSSTLVRFLPGHMIPATLFLNFYLSHHVWFYPNAFSHHVDHSVGT